MNGILISLAAATTTSSIDGEMIAMMMLICSKSWYS